ncbi:MAG TPA: 50S ribosomal protein L19 [Candidatus Paceibacterota bacterium]
MTTETIVQESLKTQLADIQPGDTVRVHQKIKEGGKERVQVFEGVILARKHGKGISATITVRKISQNVPVERIFPLHAPFIQKIEIVKRAKVRRAKLYYLRDVTGKKARLKARALGVEVVAPEEKPAQSSEGIEMGPPQSNEAGLGGKEA